MIVRFWYAATIALHPLCRIGIQRPYGWAHVRWLKAHCAALTSLKQD